MAHEYVKISELVPTTSFGTTDQFVIVQDNETVKIVGADLVQSLATLTNLATRSYVDAVVDSAPGTLDTLRELAAALNDDANFGANITALINEKLPTANFGLEFWNQLATVNTYHISEGSNLYWTQDRFDSALSSKNTYHVAEGSNLYFTNARAREALSAGEGILYNSLTGVISAPGLSSDPTFNSVTTTTLNVKNVNFTGTGAVTISSGNDLNLVAAGHVAVNGSPLVASATVDTTNAANISSGTLSNARLNAIPNSVLANSTITINGTTIDLGGAGSISTSSISEGTNLYYTDARVDSYLTSNNYATQGYVGTQIANLVNSAPTTLDTLNELATALGNDANFATTVTTSLGTKANSADLATVAISGSYTDLTNVKREESFEIKTSSFNAVSGGRYGINTTSSAITATLPASPAVGDAIFFADFGGKYSTNNLTIARNGNTIMDLSSNLIVGTDYESFGLCWNGTSWKMYQLRTVGYRTITTQNIYSHQNVTTSIQSSAFNSATVAIQIRASIVGNTGGGNGLLHYKIGSNPTATYTDSPIVPLLTNLTGAGETLTINVRPGDKIAICASYLFSQAGGWLYITELGY